MNDNSIDLYNSPEVTLVGLGVLWMNINNMSVRIEVGHDRVKIGTFDLGEEDGDPINELVTYGQDVEVDDVEVED